MSKFAKLPPSLVKSDNFRQLSSNQAENFDKRIAVIEELTQSIKRYLERRGDEETLVEFIDELELDVAAYQGLEPTSDNVTPWLTHSSWSFDTTPQKMRATITETLFGLLDTAGPTLEATARDIEAWLGRIAEGLRRSVESLTAAKSYDAAMAHLYCIDILFSHLLAGLYKTRLLDLR